MRILRLWTLTTSALPEVQGDARLDVGSVVELTEGSCYVLPAGRAAAVRDRPHFLYIMRISRKSASAQRFY